MSIGPRGFLALALGRSVGMGAGLIGTDADRHLATPARAAFRVQPGRRRVACLVPMRLAGERLIDRSNAEGRRERDGMSAFLLLTIVLAGALGALAAFRVRGEQILSLVGIIPIFCSAAVAPALIVAAEGASATVRYLGLFSLLLCSAGLTGAFIAGRRGGSGQRTDGGL